jgi:hypothetical protein
VPANNRGTLRWRTTEAHVNVAAHDAEHDAVAGHGAVAVNANDFGDDR